MTALEYIKGAIAYTKKANEAKGKPEFKGIHVVYGKLNEGLRGYFGTPTMTKDELKALPMKLVEEAIATGEIVKAFGRGGPSLYLTADAPERTERVTSPDAALKLFGMAPPPVIAPPVVKAKRTAK